MDKYLCISLSLSLSLYIYKYIYMSWEILYWTTLWEKSDTLTHDNWDYIHVTKPSSSCSTGSKGGEKNVSPSLTIYFNPSGSSHKPNQLFLCPNLSKRTVLDGTGKCCCLLTVLCALLFNFQLPVGKSLLLWFWPLLYFFFFCYVSLLYGSARPTCDSSAAWEAVLSASHSNALFRGWKVDQIFCAEAYHLKKTYISPLCDLSKFVF